MAGSRVESRVAALTTRLTVAAAPAGGWPYYPGKSSRIEPTCWALLALHGAWSGSADSWHTFAAPHLAFLGRCQRPDGLLTELPQGPTNLAADGLAAHTLAVLSGAAPPAALPRLLEGIVQLKGVVIDASDPRQNNRLQAWPWYPDTFSWIEPTAWCLLALKSNASRVSSAARARIDEAEQVMENRCCDTGGWNYGNASALGQDLRAYVPLTALGLLAVQDRRDRPYVAKSVAFLDTARAKEGSSAALGLATLALRVHGRDTTNLAEPLALATERAESLGNLHTLAIALSALTVDRHDARVFRLVA